MPPTRATTGLAAQMVVRLIAKVADAYKADRARLRRLPPARQPGLRRPHFALVRPRDLDLDRDRPPTDPLCRRRARPALLATRRARATCSIVTGSGICMPRWRWPAAPPVANADWLGVDLGVVNLAVDSDGRSTVGRRFRARAAAMRACAPNCKRKARGARNAGCGRGRRKKRRFATHVNHTLSKRLVAQAQGTQRGIALEDLTGIRARITARKAQRRDLHSWAFSQLRQFITYKAIRAGVRVVLVDPRNTSRTCPACGHCAKENRVSQSQFLCGACGLAGLADAIAAENIRRAAVIQPHLAAGSAVSGEPKALGFIVGSFTSDFSLLTVG